MFNFHVSDRCCICNQSVEFNSCALLVPTMYLKHQQCVESYILLTRTTSQPYWHDPNPVCGDHYIKLYWDQPNSTGG